MVIIEHQREGKAMRKFLLALIFVCLAASLLLRPTADDTPTYIYTDNIEIAKPGDLYSIKEIVSNRTASGFSAKFTAFTGMLEIVQVDSDGLQSINLNYFLDTLDGRLKLVFVYPDGSVFIVAAKTKSGYYTGLLPVGKTSIKIVGLDGDSSINMNYSIVNKWN